MKRLIYHLLGGWIAFVGAIASWTAHHAVAAKFDSARRLTLSGMVTDVDWANPHAHVFVNVTRDGGAVENWAVELESTVLLRRSGWQHDTLKPGDAIEVNGPTARDGSRQVWGERVIASFDIACGRCWFCERGETSLCDNSNPKPEAQDKALGYPVASFPGYSHAFGGYAGSHAEYIRLPYADMGCFRLPDEITAIMEKHIRGGLTEAEARELNLPVKDYTLRRLEERVVIYADRLVDIIYDGIVTLKSESESETRYEEILRTYPKYGKNELTLNRYLEYHREIQGLMNKA